MSVQTTFRLEINPTFREINGRFVAANADLLASRRDAVRGEGRYLVSDIRQRIRTKVGKPSKIEGGVSFRTFQSADSVKLSVTAPGRARPHRIQATNKRALAFFWPKIGRFVFVPRRGGFKTHISRDGDLWVGKGYIDHPGGSLEPLVGPLVRDAAREWQAGRGGIVLRRISTRYAAKVTGR